jgi:hypothetical protein
MWRTTALSLMAALVEMFPRSKPEVPVPTPVPTQPPQASKIRSGDLISEANLAVQHATNDPVELNGLAYLALLVPHHSPTGGSSAVLDHVLAPSNDLSGHHRSRRARLFCKPCTLRLPYSTISGRLCPHRLLDLPVIRDVASHGQRLRHLCNVFAVVHGRTTSV